MICGDALVIGPDHVPGTPVRSGSRVIGLLGAALLFFCCASGEAADEPSSTTAGSPGEVAMFAHWPELIEIRYRGRDGKVGIYPGVVVAAGGGQSTILTTALDPRGVVSLIDGEATLVADVIRTDPERNLGLLRAVGLTREPVVLSGSRLGMQVLAVSLRGVAAGQVTGIRRESRAVTWVTHNAGAQPGGVLVDECGQLVAVLSNASVAGPSGAGPSGTGLDIASVVDFLSANQVSYQQNAECETALSSARTALQQAAERARVAQDQAEKANEAVMALEGRLSQSSRRNDELERRASEARVEADRAGREAAVARALVEDARQQFEQKTREIETSTTERINEVEAGRRAAEQRLESALEAQARANRNRDQMMLVGGAMFAVVAVVGVLLWMRTRRVVPVPVSNPGTPVSGMVGQQDVILEGRDDEGTRFRVNAAIDRLETAGGMVIGRNPRDSELVVEHPDVSRRHARLRMVARQLYLEDLGSTNGTSVNGRPIDQKGQVALMEGDRVVLGSVRLNVGRA